MSLILSSSNFAPRKVSSGKAVNLPERESEEHQKQTVVRLYRSRRLTLLKLKTCKVTGSSLTECILIVVVGTFSCKNKKDERKARERELAKLDEGQRA